MSYNDYKAGQQWGQKNPFAQAPPPQSFTSYQQRIDYTNGMNAGQRKK